MTLRELQRLVESHERRFNDYLRMDLYNRDHKEIRDDLSEIKSDQRTTRNLVVGALVALVGQIIVQLIMRGG